MNGLNQTLNVLSSLAVVCLLFQPNFVLANGDGNNGGNGCPAENLVAVSSFSINKDLNLFIYGRAWVKNLKYWPWNALGAACISSDHSVNAHHYYEEEDFSVHWAYRLWIDEFPHQYQSNPRYVMNLGEYDPTQAMPTNTLNDSETLWVDLSELPAPRRGKLYHISAYTRIDAYYGPGKVRKVSWKDCVNRIFFIHFPPAR